MRRSAFHMAKPYFTREAYFTNPAGIYFVEKDLVFRQGLFLVGVPGFEPGASWTRIKTQLFNIVLLSLKSIDFMRILWYHCVIKFYSVVYLFVSLFTQVFTFWR